MYSEQLEQLIKSVIADGVITDKERSVLHKKAAAEGIDEDEIDVYIDGLIAQMKPSMPKDEKRKQRKCPHCGEILKATDIVCPNCGNEISREDVHSSIQKLFDLLKEEDEHYTQKLESLNKKNSIDKIQGGDKDGSKQELFEEQQRTLKENHEKRLGSIIENFPIPNDHEAMLEFLTTGLSQLNNIDLKKRMIVVGIETGIFLFLTIVIFAVNNTDDAWPLFIILLFFFIIIASLSFLHFETTTQEAWRTKCKQIMEKAKLAYAKDPKRLTQFIQHEKELSLWQWK